MMLLFYSGWIMCLKDFRGAFTGFPIRPIPLNPYCVQYSDYRSLPNKYKRRKLFRVILMFRNIFRNRISPNSCC